MTWDHWKFPRHPVAAEKLEMRGINTIILNYHSRVDPELGKCVYVIFRVLCACTACVVQLDKYWLTNIDPSYQPMYDRADKFYYNKIPEYYNDWIIMLFLDNKTPQVNFDNIHALILA